MDRLIYYNDKVLDAASARVAPMLAGVLYGWGVFTTVRIYGGAAFAFDRHWERLERNAERARITLSVDLSEAKRAIDELIAANSIEDGRARVTVLKGDAGAWRLEQGRECELLIFTMADQAPTYAETAITLSPIRILSTSPLAGVKRTAMLENLLALEEARSRSFSEAILLNERGEIVSATAANIFWIEGDEIYTPALATGCVAGITRGIIFDIAERMKIHLVEGGFTLQRLHDAREVFLSSTVREIVHVDHFDIHAYSRKEARMTKLIRREFQKLTRGAKII